MVPVLQAFRFGRSRLKTTLPVVPAALWTASAAPVTTPLLPEAPVKNRSSCPVGAPSVDVMEAPKTTKSRKTLVPPTVVETDGAVGGSSVSPVANALDATGFAASTPRYRRIAAAPRLFPSDQVKVALSSSSAACRYQIVSRASSSSAMPLLNSVQPAGASAVRSRARATTAMSKSPLSPEGTPTVISCGWELDRFWVVRTSTNSGAPDDAREGMAVRDCKAGPDKTASPSPSATASERNRIAIDVPANKTPRCDRLEPSGSAGAG